jgi:hypothetical protein
MVSAGNEDDVGAADGEVSGTGVRVVDGAGEGCGVIEGDGRPVGSHRPLPVQLTLSSHGSLHSGPNQPSEQATQLGGSKCGSHAHPLSGVHDPWPEQVTLRSHSSQLEPTWNGAQVAQLGGAHPSSQTQAPSAPQYPRPEQSVCGSQVTVQLAPYRFAAHWQLPSRAQVPSPEQVVAGSQYVWQLSAG